MAAVAFTAGAQMQTLNVSGTITYQKANTVSGETTKYSTGNASFNNKTIISLLNLSPEFTDTFGTIPAGAVLMMNDGDVLWTNKTAHTYEVISGQVYNADYDEDFTFIFVGEGSDSVMTGSYNNSTFQGSENVTQANQEVYVQDYEGDYIQINGLLKYNNSASKVSNGYQNVKSNGTIQGTGNGTRNYTESVVTKGTIKANGSGKVPAI